MYIERFILKKLDHPSILKYITSYKDNKFIYFQLEYAKNGTIDSFLKNQSFLLIQKNNFFKIFLSNKRQRCIDTTLLC